jgi:hypothetical protein
MFKDALLEAFKAIALMAGLYGVSSVCQWLLFRREGRRTRERRGRK